MKFQKNNEILIQQGKRHKKHVEKVPFFDAFKNLLGGNFLNILEIELTELIPCENNPRNNEETIEPVANSIKTFCFIVPIVADRNNVIIAGHTRYKTAKDLVKVISNKTANYTL